MSVIEQETEVQAPTRRDVLHRAADLLEEFGWCQKAQGLTDEREKVDALDPRATSFCLYGAYYRALRDVGGWNGTDEWPSTEAMEVLEPLGGVSWNNMTERTKAEVVAALREAAERA